MIDDMGAKGDGIVGTFAELGSTFDGAGVVMGIGYNNLPARWTAWQRVRASGRPTPALVHPRAYVSASASVGLGSLVMACAVVDRAVRLAEATVVWPAACVSHDTEIGANTFISPNVTICGNVIVGPHTFVGAAAVIADHCEVPESSFIRMQERYVSNRRS